MKIAERTWEFEAQDAQCGPWRPFSPAHQVILTEQYEQCRLEKTDQTSVTLSETGNLRSPQVYEIDFVTMRRKDLRSGSEVAIKGKSKNGDPFAPLPDVKSRQIKRLQQDKAKAEAGKAEERAKAERLRAPIPEYWTNKQHNSPWTIFSIDRKEVTWKNLEQCMRNSIQHKGECGSASLRGLQISRMQRIENHVLWQNYYRHKIALRDSIEQCMTSVPEQLSLTRRGVVQCLSRERVLDEKYNEFQLWHGTKPALAETLSRTGFDARVARDGGLYGAGSYFADASCKANQYAREVNAQGEHCMLYCRVTMGNTYCTTGQHQGQRRPPPNPKTPGMPYDSILAEQKVAHRGQQGHNEYVVFDNNQVYPEFIIWYKTK